MPEEFGQAFFAAVRRAVVPPEPRPAAALVAAAPPAWLAVAWLAVPLLAVPLLAVPLLAVALLAVDLLAVAWLAVAWLAVDLRAVGLPAVDLAAAVFAVPAARLDDRGVFVAASPPVAVAARRVLEPVAGAVLAAGRRVVAALAALSAVPCADLVARAVPTAAVPAAPRAVRAVRPAAGAVFGSFLAPLTTSLKPLPGRNFGTAVFFTFTVAPVAGLRAVRAARFCRSKTPKPAIATFSPLATALVMVSTTASTAEPAAFRSLSIRSVMASISWALFTGVLSRAGRGLLLRLLAR